MSHKSFPWGTLIKVAVSVALLAALVAFADLGKIVQAAAGFSWVWAPVILALIGASVAVSALKWGVLLKAQGLEVKPGRLFGAYSTALFFNNFLPSSIGGDGVRILIVGKETGNTPAVSASVVVERALATASLGLLGLGTGLASVHSHTLALGLLGAVAVVGLALTALIVSGWLPRRIREGKGKVSSFLVGFSGSATTLRKNPGALAASFLLSFVFQAFVAWVVGAAAAGLGLPFAGLADIVFVTSAASVLAMVPLGLNGYGLREGAFIVLLAPYGIVAASALTVSVLFAVSVSVYSLTGAAYWVAAKKRIPV